MYSAVVMAAGKWDSEVAVKVVRQKFGEAPKVVAQFDVETVGGLTIFDVGKKVREQWTIVGSWEFVPTPAGLTLAADVEPLPGNPEHHGE